MNQEESEKAISLLFNLLNDALAENTAQKMALQIANGKKKPIDRQASEFFIANVKKDILKNRSDIFAWLRGTLLSSVSDTHPQPVLLTEWEDEMRRLVESAGEIDPAEEK